MSLGGGVDQQFICCSQCRGLFTRRKSLLLHKSSCTGDPNAAKCDYYAVPFSEFMQWKKGQKNSSKSKKLRVAEPVVETVDEDVKKEPVPAKSPKKSVSDKTAEIVADSPLRVTRKRGRPPKNPPSATIIPLKVVRPSPPVVEEKASEKEPTSAETGDDVVIVDTFKVSEDGPKETSETVTKAASKEVTENDTANEEPSETISKPETGTSKTLCSTAKTQPSSAPETRTAKTFSTAKPQPPSAKENGADAVNKMESKNPRTPPVTVIRVIPTSSDGVSQKKRKDAEVSKPSVPPSKAASEPAQQTVIIIETAKGTSSVKVPWEKDVGEESIASPEPMDVAENGADYVEADVIKDDVANAGESAIDSSPVHDSEGDGKVEKSVIENDAEKENVTDNANTIDKNEVSEPVNQEGANQESATTTPSKDDSTPSTTVSLINSKTQQRAYLAKRSLDGSMLECGICDYRTKLQGMYARHMQSHNYGDQFGCEVCGQVFLHRRRYNAHMLTHNRLQCPYCEKKYTRTNDRDRHIRNAHSDEKLLYSCNSCDYTTPYQGNFTEHQRKHTGERLMCTKPGCGYKTLYKRALMHHLKSVHAVSRDFQCPDCSYRSTTKLGLNKHMVSHTAVRDKQCPQCEYKAKTVASLRTHVLKHGSGKYYYCDQCSYKTFRAYSFKNHMLIHLGLKPWVCGGCNFDAVSKEKILRHIVSRHGPLAKFSPQVRKKDIRVKLNLEAFQKDPSLVTEEESEYDSSRMVMIEVINESGENVQANFSKRHQVILKDPKTADQVEVTEQTVQSEPADEQSEDIYKCAMCAYQSDNLGDVEDHINEFHGSVAGEEVVMNFEEATVDPSHLVDITHGNIEIQEATEQEVEDMVYVIEAGTGPDQSLVIQAKANEIPDDAVFTAVESILHLQNAPEGGTVVSS